MAARGCRAYFFNFFRMLWNGYFFFGDAELFSPSMIGFFSKDFFSLLEGLEFTPAASATTKGDIYVPGTYTKKFFFIFRLLRCTDVCFFSLSGVLFPRE